MGNLIDNAMKYTNKGSITVRCETLPHGDKRLPVPVRARGGILVSIQDTGTGFDQSEARVLFQKFSRARQKVWHRGGGEPMDGNGIGLFIAKMFVDAHGGAIWATSPGRGKGSWFVFTLPS